MGVTRSVDGVLQSGKKANYMSTGEVRHEEGKDVRLRHYIRRRRGFWRRRRFWIALIAVLLAILVVVWLIHTVGTHRAELD